MRKRLQIKSFKLNIRLIIVAVILLLVSSVILSNILKMNKIKSSKQEKTNTADILSPTQHIQRQLKLEDFFYRLNFKDLNEGLHLSEIDSQYFDVRKLDGAECMDLNGSTLDFFWLEDFSKKYGNESFQKGIKLLHNKIGDKNSSLHYLCLVNDNYYLSYTDDNAPFKLSLFNIVHEVKAGSGKESVSLGKIDKDGKITIINNVETGISDSFKELSFYFSCPNIVGEMNGTKVVMLCGGSEGPESTIGLISVDFNTNKSDYINYCINPLEDLSNPFGETDFTYTCYENGKHVYYTGLINYNNSQLFSNVTDR
jgi:hypothetical protein